MLLDRGDSFPAEEVVFDPGGIVLREAQVQGAEGGHRAAHSHRTVHPGVVEGAQLLGEDLPHVRADLLELLIGRGIASDEPLGEPDASKLKADELRALLSLAADDLGAAAPDVHHDRTAMGGAEPAHDGQEHEARFLFSGEDVDGVSDSLRVTVRDLAPIAGDAEGVGASDTDLACSGVFRFVDEAFEAVEGPLGCGLIDHTGAIEPFAETRDLAHPVGGFEAFLLVYIGDQQSYRVGADVDRTDPHHDVSQVWSLMFPPCGGV